jgi:hypothetical protein
LRGSTESKDSVGTGRCVQPVFVFLERIEEE